MVNGDSTSTFHAATVGESQFPDPSFVMTDNRGLFDHPIEWITRGILTDPENPSGTMSRALAYDGTRARYSADNGISYTSGNSNVPAGGISNSIDESLRRG